MLHFGKWCYILQYIQSHNSQMYSTISTTAPACDTWPSLWGSSHQGKDSGQHSSNYQASNPGGEQHSSSLVPSHNTLRVLLTYACFTTYLHTKFIKHRRNLDLIPGIYEIINGTSTTDTIVPNRYHQDFYGNTIAALGINLWSTLDY